MPAIRTARQGVFSSPGPKALGFGDRTRWASPGRGALRNADGKTPLPGLSHTRAASESQRSRAGLPKAPLRGWQVPYFRLLVAGRWLLAAGRLSLSVGC